MRLAARYLAFNWFAGFKFPGLSRDLRLGANSRQPENHEQMSDKLQFVDASMEAGFAADDKLKFIGHKAQREPFDQDVRHSNQATETSSRIPSHAMKNYSQTLCLFVKPCLQVHN